MFIFNILLITLEYDHNVRICVNCRRILDVLAETYVYF